MTAAQIMRPKLTYIGTKVQKFWKKLLSAKLSVKLYLPVRQRMIMAKIDIGSIVKKKFGGFPEFLIPALERFIHQDFINGFLEQGYEGVEFCRRCLDYLDVNIEVRGMENLPDGPCTVVSNHPLGGIDAVALMAIVGERYSGNIRLLANDFLMNISGLAPMLVPVNKIGAQSADLKDRVDAMFSGGCQAVVFPSGKVSRKRGKVIEDQDWKPTFLRKSLQYGRCIVPVHFYGRNSWRFYALDRIAVMLRCRFPLAMALLPDELYRSRGKTFSIVIGKPVPAAGFDASRTVRGWAEWLRQTVYSL